MIVKKPDLLTLVLSILASVMFSASASADGYKLEFKVQAALGNTQPRNRKLASVP